MREFIQKRMDLTRNEAERFTPVFIRYFREWRTTLRDNGKGQKLICYKELVELRISYRPNSVKYLVKKEVMKFRSPGKIYTRTENDKRGKNSKQTQRQTNKEFRNLSPI